MTSFDKLRSKLLRSKLRISNVHLFSHLITLIKYYIGIFSIRIDTVSNPDIIDIAITAFCDISPIT